MTAQSSFRRFADRLVSPGAVGPETRPVVLLRAAVGGVFLVSGLLKFLFDNQGAGRFAKLGLPAPHQLATFVGALEILAGVAIALGILTRPAALALGANMIVALVTTKVPLLFGAGPEPVMAFPKVGLLAFAYQARLDLTMLLASAHLAWAGAGRWSFDAWRARRRGQHAPEAAVVPPSTPVRLAG